MGFVFLCGSQMATKMIEMEVKMNDMGDQLQGVVAMLAARNSDNSTPVIEGSVITNEANTPATSDSAENDRC